MTLKTNIVAVLCLLCYSTTQAVVIRHDVPEKEYLELAAKPEFQAGLITVLDSRGDYTGVLISSRHILTAGHPVVGFLPDGKSDGPMTVRVRFLNSEYETEYAYLHPLYVISSGTDLAVIRLKKPGITDVRPASIWSGGVSIGDRFVGVGQGKSGTGKDVYPPKPTGTFRGYENTIDYLFDDKGFYHFRSDFDDGTDESNTLARVLFGDPYRAIQGQSSKTPLPLEGNGGAGDSGSGVWIQRGTEYYLAGILSYGYYSMYGGQAAYVNLSHSANIGWLKKILSAITPAPTPESIPTPTPIIEKEDSSSGGCFIAACDNRLSEKGIAVSLLPVCSLLGYVISYFRDRYRCYVKN